MEILRIQVPHNCTNVQCLNKSVGAAIGALSFEVQCGQASTSLTILH